MIVKNINDDACVESVALVQTTLTSSHNVMCIRKGVNLSMESDSFLDVFGIMCKMISSNAIRNKVPDHNFGITFGEIEMCEEVQGLIVDVWILDIRCYEVKIRKKLLLKFNFLSEGFNKFTYRESGNSSIVDVMLNLFQHLSINDF
mgnify:CR=1 FL=1